MSLSLHYLFRLAAVSRILEAVSHCSDFERLLEGLRLLLRKSRIFCPLLRAKKGACLARCTGELRAGPSGWMHINAEALDLLAFRKAEPQWGVASKIWRPPRNTPRFYHTSHNSTPKISKNSQLSSPISIKVPINNGTFSSQSINK